MVCEAFPFLSLLIFFSSVGKFCNEITPKPSSALCHPEYSEIRDQPNQSEEFQSAQDAAQPTSIRHIPPAVQTPTPHVTWITSFAITHDIVCELCIGNIFVFSVVFARREASCCRLYHGAQSMFIVYICVIFIYFAQKKGQILKQKDEKQFTALSASAAVKPSISLSVSL